MSLRRPTAHGFKSPFTEVEMLFHLTVYKETL